MCVWCRIGINSGRLNVKNRDGQHVLVSETIYIEGNKTFKAVEKRVT